MARKAPNLATLRRLFTLSGNQCAFPGCNHKLVDEDGVFVAEICHIEAAEPLGERYNKRQTDEERRCFENLMLMCHAHHKKTDDIKRFDVFALKEIKKNHETQFSQNHFIINDDALDNAYESIEKKLECIINQNNTTHELLGSLNQHIQFISQNVALDQSKIYSEQLEFINKFKKEQKYNTLLESLLLFKKSNWLKINDELKYKVLANISVAMFNLGRKHEGAEYLVELEDISWKTPDSLSYLCLAYAILHKEKEFTVVFNKTRALAPNNINLWVSYIHMYKGSVSVRDIHADIPTILLERNEILFTLGEAYVDHGDSSLGFEMINKSLESGGISIAENWLFIGTAITRKLMDLVTPEKILLGGFSNDELDEIRKYRNKLSELWAYVSQTELALGAAFLVMNRGLCWKILGDLKQAEKDLLTAWTIAKNLDTFKALLLHYCETLQFDKGEDLLLEAESRIENDKRIEYAMCKARLFTLKGDIDVAIQTLENQLIVLDEGEERLRILDVITLTCFQLKVPDRAFPFALQTISEFPNSPFGYLSQGICYKYADEYEKALLSFNTALEKEFDEKNGNFVLFQLGNEFAQLRNHQKAAFCYEKITDISVYDKVQPLLVLEYFRADRYDEAIELCLRIKEQVNNDPRANEILFRSYVEIGEKGKAEKIISEYVKIGKPDSLDYFRFIGGQFFASLEELDRASDFFIQISDPSSFSLEERMLVAQVLLDSGKVVDGLEVAYDARIDHFENGRAHDLYVKIVLRDKSHPIDLLFPDQVGINNAVHFVDQAGTKTFFFITDDSRLNMPYTLRPSNKLSERLMGKTIGDIIEMPNNVGAGSVLKIEKIMSKDVFAFQESLDLLSTRFSEVTDMVFGKFG